MKKTEGRNRYLAKNTFIFTLGNIGSKFISFILIPLYTNCLTTEQYGLVDLVATIATVAVPMVTLNIGEAIMRFGLDENADREKNTQIGIFMLAVAAVIGLLFLGSGIVYNQIYSYVGYVYFYIVSLAACQIFMCDLRGKELLLKYSIGSILDTFLIAAFNILFLVGLQKGIQGYLLAYSLANLITAGYAFWAGKCKVRWTFPDRNLLWAMAKYSVVLIPNSFMWWIMNSSDRLMVTAMVGAAANGIYAVSYKLPTIVSTLAGIFNQAWSYSAIREENAIDKTEYNNKTLRMLTGWSVLVGLFVLAFTKPLLYFFVERSYFEAWKYTPYLVVGSVYMALGTFLSTSYTVHKDSFGFLSSGMFGAVINVILNFLTIPVWKVHGAASSTCISYIAVFVFRYNHTKKYIHYRIWNIEFVLGSILLLSSSFLMYTDNIAGETVQVIILVLGMAVFSRDWIPMVKKVVRRVLPVKMRDK